MFKVNSLKSRFFILTGFMGAGKTFIGRAAANKLNCQFVDLDSYIEEQENKSVYEIFKSYSEKRFRELETKYFIELTSIKSDLTIIAVGGGFPLKEENQLLIHKHTTIYIDTDFNIILSRLKGNEKNKRPVLNNLTEDGIKKLYESRLPIYKNTADYIARNLNEIVDYIKQNSIKDF